MKSIVQTCVEHLLELHTNGKTTITMKMLKKSIGDPLGISPKHVNLPRNILAAARASLCNDHNAPCHLVSGDWFELSKEDRIATDSSVARCLPQGRRVAEGIRFVSDTDDPFFIYSIAKEKNAVGARLQRAPYRLKSWIQRGILSERATSLIKGGADIQLLMDAVGVDPIGDEAGNDDEECWIVG